MKNFKIIPLLAIAVFMLYSFKTYAQEVWVVPSEYETMKNPVDANDKEALAIGKNLYTKHCKSCHGVEGYGDGPKADQLDSEAGDFSTEDFQNQSDGNLFYKSKEGRDDMPTFKVKIPSDKDLWSIINYVRTLKE